VAAGEEAVTLRTRKKTSGMRPRARGDERGVPTSGRTARGPSTTRTARTFRTRTTTTTTKTTKPTRTTARTTTTYPTRARIRVVMTTTLTTKSQRRSAGGGRGRSSGDGDRGYRAVEKSEQPRRHSHRFCRFAFE